jgi:hypothetical protein
MASIEPTDTQYALADAIELVLERTELGTDWSPSEIARKLPGKPATDEVSPVLQWMEEHVYVVSNGRGGCWRRYGRRR